MQPGQVIDIKIDNIAAGGEGIGSLDGIKVFVENSLPGEELKVKLLEVKKSYARGKVAGFVSRSPERVDPPCRYFELCGACHLQHMAYKAQLRYKTRIVKDVVARIAGLDPRIVRDIVPSPLEWGYRNKMQYPIRQVRNKAKIQSSKQHISMGYYRKGTHEVIDIDNCPVLHPALNLLASAARKALNGSSLPAYDEDSGKGLFRHLLGRTAFSTGQSSATFVINGQTFPGSRGIVKAVLDDLDPSVRIKNISYNSNLRRTNVILGAVTRTILGTDNITEVIGDIRFAISPGSFFQINPGQAEKMFDKVSELCCLSGNETVFDLYSGGGAIALWLAKKARAVYGVEEIKSAVSDARGNAALNGIKNVYFRSGKVETELRKLSLSGIRADILVLDPPRSGCSASVIRSVMEHCSGKIIYVSCDPATLSRDLKLLSDRYRVDDIVPFDMFPQTAHVECVAALSNR